MSNNLAFDDPLVTDVLDAGPAEQPLLDGQPSSDEDEDVFQCGKCKQQFRALDTFVGHKRECGKKVEQSTSGGKSPIRDGAAEDRTPSLEQPRAQSPQLPSSVIHLSESDLLSIANSVQSTVQIEQPLNGGTIQLIAASNADPVISGGSTTGSGNTIFPVSLIANGSLLAGTPLLALTTNSSGSSGDNNELSSVSLPTNIVLNISNAITLNDGQSQGESTGKRDQSSKKLEAVNVLPSSDGSLPKKSSDKDETDSDQSDPKRAKLKLKCHFCSRGFSKNFDLQQHIRCHTGEKPFQCVVCGRAFAQKSNVKKHLQTHKVWPESGLNHTLPSPSKEALSEPPVADEPEPVGSESPGSEQPTETESAYVCSYCSFAGKTYFELKTHMKSHKREKVFKCIQSSCGQMFTDLEAFLDHLSSHDRTEMTYRCHQCTTTFNTLYDLGLHQYTHAMYPNQGSRSGQKYYRCNKCLNKYTTPTALEHHHATSSHHYPCSHCSKVFPCERYLRRHLLTHGKELHICQFCEKTFKTANYLKIHSIIHSGEKPYSCDRCNAAFNRRDKLKRHKLVHDPVKRFKCPFRAHTGCPKEFNRPDKLKAHILTHSGIRPHQCNQCGRSFSRRAHLRSHLASHVNSSSSDQPKNIILLEGVDKTVESSENDIEAIMSKGDFITLFDCDTCGTLYTSEQIHQCSTAPETTKRKVVTIQKATGKKHSLKAAHTTKSNSKSPALTLSLPLTEKTDGDIAYQLTDPLTDLPSTQIEIITSNTDFSTFPSIVIDGSSIPLLTGAENDDLTSQDSIDLSKSNRLLSELGEA